MICLEEVLGMEPDPVETQLLQAWGGLGDVERRVVVRIMVRIKMGQDQYGMFGDKDRDRNFMREVQEELLDASVYAAAYAELLR